MSKAVRKRKKPEPPATPLAALLEKHLENLLLRDYSEYTVRNRRVHIGYFLEWAYERGITEPVEVTRTVLEAYQKHIFHYRKKSGEPLGFNGQHDRIVPLRVWFKWMARHHHILHNPASELELPRLGVRLPKAVLTAAEAEQVLQQPGIHDVLGLRDRAIMETLYTTGMRRLELVNLKLWDLDLERATVTIRQGKGKKDRIIPLGDRTALWVLKYLEESRPKLADEPDEHILFLSNAGEPFSLDYLTEMVRNYVDAANIGKRGACHLFRHTMATLMLEGGADIRFIQAMLGHADLKTTQIYTHVAVRQLQEIHRATHPAKLEREKPMTREQWLLQMVGRLRPVFEGSGHPLPLHIRVSCGWPTQRALAPSGKNRTIGQCFSTACSADSAHEVFISPALDDKHRVADVLVHELCHAVDNCRNGHGPVFRGIATAVGLEGPMTATTAGPLLRERLNALMEKLPDYPHRTLDVRVNAKKQGTRLLKIVCPGCGYTARTTRQWIDRGLPTCPCGTLMASGD